MVRESRMGTYRKEIDAEEKSLQLKRLQSIIDEANEGTQAKIDAEISFAEFKQQADQALVTAVLQ